MVLCTKCGEPTSRILIGIDGKCIRCLQAEINICSERQETWAEKRERDIKLRMGEG